MQNSTEQIQSDLTSSPTYSIQTTSEDDNSLHNNSITTHVSTLSNEIQSELNKSDSVIWTLLTNTTSNTSTTCSQVTTEATTSFNYPSYSNLTPVAIQSDLDYNHQSSPERSLLVDLDAKGEGKNSFGHYLW